MKKALSVVSARLSVKLARAAAALPAAAARRVVAAIVAAAGDSSTDNGQASTDNHLKIAFELDMQPLGQTIANILQSGDEAAIRNLAAELSGLLDAPALTAAVTAELSAALAGTPPPAATATTPARFEAAKVAAIRKLLPTTLGSAELRGVLAEDLRARSVFVSRGSNLDFLSRLKHVINLVTDGEMDRATARWQLKEVLAAVGYTPQGGFPADLAGSVPPAVAGSIRDLSSDKRLNFIIDTQVRLMQGRGQQLLGQQPAALRNFPAFELVRIASRRAPRKWGGIEQGHPGQKLDTRERWEIAGGKMTGLRMIALKGDPVWGELGGSGNFDDALDVDYPPFAFNSGMGWRTVTRAECLRLGVTGPDGETIDEWQAMDHPLLVDTQSGLPAPQLSVQKADPALTADFLRMTGGVEVDGIATTAEGRAELLAQIEGRRIARDHARAQALRDAITQRREEYARQ
ncbi:MAG: hypothetical protein WCK77_24100 [Verrucomicrobiota bacterium]